MKNITRLELLDYLNQYLKIDTFNDYCPNGLQIEGTTLVKNIAFAVSATRESIEKAVELKVDTLIVHHGLFWKFHGTKPIIEAFAARVKPLIKNDINLIGYHLPLDAHIESGNAAVIAKRLSLTQVEPFGEYKGSYIGVKGIFPEAIPATKLSSNLKKILNHDIIHSCYEDNQSAAISSIGIITGGANSDWVKAKEDGLDAYLTGEISEHDYHESREAGIHMFAGGHNATEVFGVQELMSLLKDKFSIQAHFIPSNNPA